MDLTLPYFEVGLRWIDAASDNRSQHVIDAKYMDIAALDFTIRNNGSVAVIRNDTWDAGKAIPQAAETFLGTKLISIKVGTLLARDELPDGSSANQNSPCPTTSEEFGKLPDVGQQNVPYFWNDANSTWAANDCFLIAEASITAGKYKGTDCTMSPAGAIDYTATCIVTPNSSAVEDDWISGLTLDFMSETMKHTVMLNLTQPWMRDNLDGYATGMLTLAYHATWSSLMQRLDNASEPTTVREAESVVRATVDRTRICIWLAMRATLTVSALLVAMAQNVSTTKTIRDTTLAALAIDLTEVTHSGCASGLCNAVALSKEDHKLPRLKFTDCEGRESDRPLDDCRRRAVFAKSNINVHGVRVINSIFKSADELSTPNTHLSRS